MGMTQSKAEIINFPSTGSNGKINYLAFNQDHHCFYLGTSVGFAIYNLTPFQVRASHRYDSGIGVVESIGKSNIFCLVGGGSSPMFSPTNLVCWDDRQKKTIAQLEFPTEVKSVKSGDKKIMVVFAHKIMIYNFNDLRLISQFDTSSNQGGLGAISYHPDKKQTVLAIPGGRPGVLRVEFLEKRKSHAIPAHQNDLSQICLNQEGTLCATTSDRGTLVRIWKTDDGQLMKELRRGIEPCQILSLNFNQDSTGICLSNDKGTIHVYSLIPRSNAPKHEKNKKSSFSFMKNYLPNYFSSEWSMTSFSIPGSLDLICSFLPGEKQTLVVISKNGKVYHYRYIPETNQVQLIRTFNFNQ